MQLVVRVDHRRQDLRVAVGGSGGDGCIDVVDTAVGVGVAVDIVDIVADVVMGGSSGGGGDGRCAHRR